MSAINGVMMQYFHWYYPDDGRLWREAEANAVELAAAGITALWLPPAYKGLGGASDVGYATYDMYDLGEFEQHGSVRTKYGTKAEYVAAIEALRAAGIQVYADAVLNHRIGGDDTERVKALPFRQDDRLRPIGDVREIVTYTHFAFPGRAGRYSPFEWHWWHFDAVDWDEAARERGLVYLLEGKRFDDYVALENGNFAYLLGCDLDFQNAEVRDEVTAWGRWYLDTTSVDGFRLDALKHISAWFFPDWVGLLEQHVGRDLFFVGEYWTSNLDTLIWYLDAVRTRMALFDVPLHYKLHEASRGGGRFDMRRIFDGTLVQSRPMHAVTFVENHDSQPLEALESVVEPWFKPLAYALILLRRDGYPCVFHADYYGADYRGHGRDGNVYDIHMPAHRAVLDELLALRRDHAHGEQLDYLDHWNRIGWTRLGDEAHPQAMAVLLSDGPEGSKWMDVRRPGARFIDRLGHMDGEVVANEHGWAEFRCAGGSVSVWVEQ